MLKSHQKLMEETRKRLASPPATEIAVIPKERFKMSDKTRAWIQERRAKEAQDRNTSLGIAFK